MSMAMRPRLEMRQTQQLVMTPQLRQAISMLQMSALELSGYLAREIETNPLLSVADGLGEGQARAAPAEAGAVDGEMRRADLAAGEAQFVTGRENLYEAGDAPRPRTAGTPGESFDEGRSAAMVDTPSLTAHVVAQLALMRLPPQVRAVAALLAGELDEAGYLRAADAELASRLGADEAVIAAARRAVQACEPTGLAARTLAECLALQLAERNRLDPAMAALIDALELLPTTPAAILARRCGVSAEDFSDMLAELRALDPRPGLQHGGGTATVIVPDVLVRPDPAGGWAVSLNPSAMPRVLVDTTYAASVGARADSATKLFLSECSQNAAWLRKSLDQRARTILTVASEIVKLQAGFLDRGLPGLRPMTLRMVAETVGVHESTVSRVTANKFMATPRGTFELRYFFSTAIAAADGGDTHSAQAVKALLRRLIAAEPPGKPLSDDTLVKMLRAQGVDVARRTVAKYREALHIPSSVERRRRAEAAV